MEKVLIHLFVPAVQESFDLFVPQDILIDQIIASMTEGIFEITHQRYSPSGKEMLIMENSSVPLCPENTLNQYGIQDGEHLIIV